MIARCAICDRPIMLLPHAGWQHHDLMTTYDHNAEENPT